MSEEQYLSLEEILSANDVIEEDFPVPEWGGKVRIRSLTVGQSLEITNMSRVTGGRNSQPVVDTRKALFLTMVKGVVAPVIDANFIERMMDKNSGVILRIVSRINELSGVSLSEEDLAKNLEGVQS